MVLEDVDPNGKIKDGKILSVRYNNSLILTFSVYYRVFIDVMVWP